MKKMIMLTALLTFACAGVASATIGWAGNVWPNSGAAVVPTGPVDVYVQVWKSGVTDMPGQGADIQVDMYLSNDLGATQTVTLSYHGDVGSNDEYTGQIPQSMLLGTAWVNADFEVFDLSDATSFTGLQDQAGNTAPLTYNVSDVLPNDVDVKFTICMSGEPFTGGPCVVGSAAEINSWGSGVAMNPLGGDLFEVVVTFLAGGNPSFEYKYQKDGCAAWEGVPNRLVSLPTDGTASVDLPADSWNNLPMGCGMGSTLEEDKEVCFQVCVDSVGTTGEVCVVGNHASLDNWGYGTPAVEIGPGLYQACVIFPAGSAMPINLEYKFKKDDCSTWESVGNRLFTVDNSIPAENPLNHNWDDGAGACAPVGNENASFGTIKAMFR